MVVADPVASVGNVQVTEGDSGTTTMTFPVTLDQASDRSVTLDYTTAYQTANAPSDYVATSGTLTFAPGETNTRVNVTVNGDLTFEPDETLLLRLSMPVRPSIRTNDGVGTIANNDPEPPRVTVTAVSPSTIDQGATGVPVTITGSGFDPSATVNFANTRITPVAGSLQYVDPTTLTLNLNFSTVAALGSSNVTVTAADGTATCTNCLTVAARPTVTSADLSFPGQGAKNREITITGSNFRPGATLQINGASVVSTSYIDNNTLEALVSVNPSVDLGCNNVAVYNPDRGKGLCTGCFSIVAGLKVTSTSTTTFTRGTTPQVTIRGTIFSPGVKVIGSPGVTYDCVIRQDATTIVATATTSTTARRGTTPTITVVTLAVPATGRAPTAPSR